MQKKENDYEQKLETITTNVIEQENKIITNRNEMREGVEKQTEKIKKLDEKVEVVKDELEQVKKISEDKIEQNSRKIAEVENEIGNKILKVEEIRVKLEEKKDERGSIKLIQVGVQIPQYLTFSGAPGENPKGFINALENYFELNEADAKTKLSEVRQTLKGSAVAWLKAITETTRNLRVDF